MKYFKDANNQITAYESDGSQDNFILAGLTAITQAEADALRAPSLDIVKASQWESIKAKREQIKAGGVKVGTKWFHSDIESRVQHLGLKDKARDLLAGGGAMTDRLQVGGVDIQWKTQNGTLIYITAQIAFDIVAAIGVLDKAAFGVAEYHRASMNASEDPGAYDFSAGWPSTYQV
jgi:hypothetical protein